MSRNSRVVRGQRAAYNVDLAQALGAGAFADVFLAEVVGGNPPLTRVAARRLRGETDAAIAQVRTEVGNVSLLAEHPNVVEYLDCTTVGEAWVFTEYMTGGSLTKFLKATYPPPGGMPEPVIAVLTHDALQGLQHLHSHGILHRNLTLGNMLLTEDGRLKIADFGLSKNTAESFSAHRSASASLRYMSPEACASLPGAGDGGSTDAARGQARDIWALGCCVVVLSGGRLPSVCAGFNGEFPRLRDAASSVLQDFCNQCFAPDPERRPSAQELLEHPLVAAAGRIEAANGERYFGDAIDGQPRGRGFVRYPDGRTLEGVWTEGRCVGLATMRWPGGEVFVGEFQNGQPHGKGKLTRRGGSAFEGDWANGNFVRSLPPSYCPIARHVMVDPVVDSEGQSYERAAIEAWLQHSAVSPVTLKPLNADALIPNLALKEMLQATPPAAAQ